MSSSASSSTSEGSAQGSCVSGETYLSPQIRTTLNCLRGLVEDRYSWYRIVFSRNMAEYIIITTYESDRRPSVLEFTAIVLQDASTPLSEGGIIPQRVFSPPRSRGVRNHSTDATLPHRPGGASSAETIQTLRPRRPPPTRTFSGGEDDFSHHQPFVLGNLRATLDTTMTHGRDDGVFGDAASRAERNPIDSCHRGCTDPNGAPRPEG